MSPFAVMGGLHPGPEDGAPEGTATLLLLGPGPEMWPAFRASPEASDGAPDPLDRWSRRVGQALADQEGAGVLFPFGTPAWPFVRWALRTGRIWQSPIGMLVGADAGLWVSFRAALAYPDRRPVPPPAARPCEGCAAPCLSVCPVGALKAGRYDMKACRAWLGGPEDQCLDLGCAARRACPVAPGRVAPDQAAFHMAAFHPRPGRATGRRNDT